jgi:phosphohistidine phosphatase
MELFLIRHGEAGLGSGDGGGPELSAKGIDDAGKVLRLIKDLKTAPSIIFSSQLLRAVQTAELFNKSWQVPIKMVDWLHPAVEPSRVIHELKQIPEQKIALVGHLPSLGWLLSVLLWGIPPKEILVPKGSVSFVRVSHWEPSGGEIQWMLNPDILTA